MCFVKLIHVVANNSVKKIAWGIEGNNAFLYKTNISLVQVYYSLESLIKCVKAHIFSQVGELDPCWAIGLSGRNIEVCDTN